jgi:hypothetical protein
LSPCACFLIFILLSAVISFSLYLKPLLILRESAYPPAPLLPGSDHMALYVWTSPDTEYLSVLWPDHWMGPVCLYLSFQLVRELLGARVHM